MSGGFIEWEGDMATGWPETMMTMFPSDAPFGEKMALAWFMEEGNRRFYSELVSMLENEPISNLYERLVSAEDNHQERLKQLYTDVTGGEELTEFIDKISSGAGAEPLLEGGVRLNDALRWVEGKDPIDILEASMALEANSYDFYLKMSHSAHDNKCQVIFKEMADEEWSHLRKIGAFIE